MNKRYLVRLTDEERALWSNRQERERQVGETTEGSDLAKGGP
jgi:hypothetical protein